MTPEESSAQEQELVRDLLASAAGPEPMPEDVRSRLDDVLADLVATRGADGAGDADSSGDAGDPTPPASLDARRRRRWPKVLVAAAAVSVLAYGAGVVGLDLMTDSGSDSMTAADAGGGDADSAEGGDGALLERERGHTKRDRDQGDASEDEIAPGEAESAPTTAPTSRPQHDAPDPTDDRGQAGSSTEAYRDRGATPQLRVATLGADIAAVSAVELRSATKSETNGSFGSLLDMDPRCGTPREAAGDVRYAVRLEGDRATLVLRKVHEGLRVAQIYSCDDAPTMLASTVVPGR